MESIMKKISSKSMLKFACWLGAIIDGILAVMWFLIASGYKIPNLLNGHVGSGVDYQLSMYVAALFMAGWTVLFIWCAQKPVERKGFLIITASLIFISVIVEIFFWSDLLKGFGFIFGVCKRLFLMAFFSFIYFYSFKKE